MLLSLPTPLDILGLSLRLPGADDLEALWSLLESGGSAVQDVSPPERWRAERFLSQDAKARGTTYTFAGGYLRDGLSFDAAAFGMSRREAEQMDPQQRVLLEVTWEALEDAGIAPSRLAGRQVGVYVGASATDYADVPLLDLASIDAHFMTGNSLAMVSNRISYAYDLKGPSLTIDTACSSSVVALAQAAAALQEGRIECAIVGGVNMLSSPAPFIGFSRAGMLSPTGRCRPFSAQGDGYVRAEGAVVIVLARADAELVPGGARPRARLHAIGVNSDGRTNGISLPSLTGQRDLLEALYRTSGISPDALAFVEAHGTGTRVGDPIEARAIGESLGRHRRAPLPIGSVKSNIGHLESASGMAGLAKLVLSLERRRYPATLYLEELNPDIDVAGLQLAPAAEAVELPAEGELLAGLCNYGFGGTNAHAVIGSAPVPLAAPAGPSRFLVISAHSKAALRALANAHIDPVLRHGAAVVAQELHLTREALPHRLVLDLAQQPDVALALGDPDTPRPGVVLAEAVARRARIAFVFAGNGSQWPGMGRAAYQNNPAFRARFDEIAALIRGAGGTCPLETMQAPDVAARLAATSAMQPLLFTIQLALCAALAAEGLRPDLVLGHSVGEVAAATAAGALTAEDSIRLIVQRSAHQESVRGLGSMAVLACDAARAAELIAEADAAAAVEVAARNAPNSTTISGTTEGLAEVLRVARRLRVATVTLDIAYPFHSQALDPEREGTIAALAGMRPQGTRIPMISSVTGAAVRGDELDGTYWWSNIRAPILFQAAVEAALGGAELFIEIGPRPILGSLVAEIARAAGARAVALPTLTQAVRPEDEDPVARIPLEAVARGARLAETAAASASPCLPSPCPPSLCPPSPGRLLPLMRWDRQFYLIGQTPEAYGLYGPSFGGKPVHPLIGTRLAPGGAEWRQIISLETHPYLAGHKVDGEAILPATAFMEMVAAVGREVHGTGRLRILDLDILRPMNFEPGGGREVSLIWNEADRLVEIRSRLRLEPATSLALHARAVVLPEVAATPAPSEWPASGIPHDEAAIYAATQRCRMGYEGAFRVARSARVCGDLIITELAPEPADLGFFSDVQLLDPPSYDAAFHAIFLGIPQQPGQVLGELPVRMERLSLYRPGTPVHRAVTRLVRQGADARVFDITLLSAEDEVVAEGRGVVMRRLILSTWREADRIVQSRMIPWEAGARDLAAELAEALAHPVAEAPGVAPLRAALVELGLDVAAHVVGGIGGMRIAAQDPGLGGRILPAAQVVWRALMDALCDAGRMTEHEEQFRLAALPADPTQRLVAFAQRHPGASADLRLALHALEALPGLLLGGVETPPQPDLLDALMTSSVFGAPSQDALLETLDRLILATPERRLRVVLLEPGLGGLLARLLPRLRGGEIALSILAGDVAAAERLLARLGAARMVPVLGPDSALEGAVFDLALCAATTPLDGGEPSPLDMLASLGAQAPVLLAAIPGHDPAIDVLHAAMPGWFRFSPTPELPVGAWPYPSEADEALASRGFTILRAAPIGASGARLVSAVMPRRRPLEVMPPRSPLCLAIAEDAEGAAFRDMLPGFELRGALSVGAVAELAAQALLPEGFAVVLEIGPAALADEVECLSARMLRLRDLALALSESETPCRLYVVVRQAEGAAAQALAAYARCLMNEFPTLETCLLVLAPGATAATLEPALRRHLAEPLREREVHVTETGAEVPRAARLAPPAARAPAEGERCLLRIGPRGLDELAWMLAPRATPGPGEIEVAVAATGLNFRDVMLGLGVLDSESLGGGLTGAALGFEFAGHVLAQGPGVEGFRPGDPVMGFAGGAFASHLTVPAAQLFHLGQDIPAEAGAAIPVAFVTAWYGLIERAGLKRGETVLIEGAAGGVGLAALQIAQAHGAIVVAAAGTPEKRALLRRLGADHVVDSRAPDLEDVIRAAVGGVDIVLNSVAGDAMRAALRLVRPFGRFVELGKRDFLENTRLGLRPFLRNVTYIGADIDQLLAHDPALVRRMLGALMTLFEAGRLAPLPYLAMPGERVADAFRLMQASAHIGKILVRPSRRGEPPAEAPAAFTPAPGVHVVLGGTGGFGLETALWLAGQGAGLVILASRRGTVEPEQAERLDRLRAEGRTLLVEALDVTDPAAVAAAFGRWRAQLGPIAGVIHCAMVLEDGMILGLTPEKILRVLAPKIHGMRALEAAIAGDRPQYVVAYSSATTFVGSPGQSAYVVGNAFLEGAVLALRQRGIPALAVGWGAISDVGVIARTRGLAERLRAATGVSGVTSAEALRHLGGLLAAPWAAPAVSAYSVIRWSPAATKLAVLRSPYFAEVFAEAGQGAAQPGEEALDLSALSPEAAAEILLGLVRDEVARILRLPPEAVETDRPLMDLGLDSLMALELRLAVEKRTGLEMTMTMVGGSRSVRDLVGRIAATLGSPPSH
ncbi:MAG: SDR family NAD(P)-dependent oxidoreductase [Roseococcus sp.]|nr:SDR family NAD(P)-dependent oxidoreductase [Roseococcus sp.]